MDDDELRRRLRAHPHFRFYKDYVESYESTRDFEMAGQTLLYWWNNGSTVRWKFAGGNIKYFSREGHAMDERYVRAFGRNPTDEFLRIPANRSVILLTDPIYNALNEYYPDGFSYEDETNGVHSIRLVLIIDDLRYSVVLASIVLTPDILSFHTSIPPGVAQRFSLTMSIGGDEETTELLNIQTTATFKDGTYRFIGGSAAIQTDEQLRFHIRMSSKKPYLQGVFSRLFFAANHTLVTDANRGGITSVECVARFVHISNRLIRLVSGNIDSTYLDYKYNEKSKTIELLYRKVPDGRFEEVVGGEVVEIPLPFKTLTRRLYEDMLTKLEALESIPIRKRTPEQTKEQRDLLEVIANFDQRAYLECHICARAPAAYYVGQTGHTICQSCAKKL